MSAKYSATPSTSTMTIPDFFSKRTPFYTNPKERNFLQEVLMANWYILGLSLFVVIYVGIVLGVHSSLSMSSIGTGGYPVSMEGNLCLTIPIMLVGFVFGHEFFRYTGRLSGT